MRILTRTRTKKAQQEVWIDFVCIENTNEQQLKGNGEGSIIWQLECPRLRNWFGEATADGKLDAVPVPPTTLTHHFHAMIVDLLIAAEQQQTSVGVVSQVRRWAHVEVEGKALSQMACPATCSELKEQRQQQGLSGASWAHDPGHLARPSMDSESHAPHAGLHHAETACADEQANSAGDH